MPKSNRYSGLAALVPAALATLACSPEPARGQELATFDLGASSLTVAFSPDGKRLAYEDLVSRLIRVIDLETKKERSYEGYKVRVQHVEYSADGKLLAGADQGGVLNLFDVETGAVRHTITGVRACLRPFGFAPKGNLLAAIHADGSLGIYETNNFKQLAKLPEPEGPPMALAFSPDGGSIAVGIVGGVVAVYAVGDRKLLWRRLDFQKGSCTVSFSPDGKLLVSGGERGRLSLRDAATGERKATFDQSDQLRGPTGAPLFLPGRARPAFHSLDLPFVFFWEPGNDREALVLQTGHVGGIRALALSSDGRTLATAGRDRRIKLFDVSKVKKLVKLSEIF